MNQKGIWIDQLKGSMANQQDTMLTMQSAYTRERLNARLLEEHDRLQHTAGRSAHHDTTHKCQHVLKPHGGQEWPDGEQCHQGSKRL